MSNDITRGSVTQNLGDVSKAEFYLRNRFKKWLRDPNGSGKPIFLPMDLVTIWLQRLPGQPIQQFTGYLDAVPYYQGYPGDAPFAATCTLKKMMYTWFDPGLAFFQNWLISNGWIYDPTTGQAINPTLNWDTQSVGPNAPLGSSLNDGSFGRLLGNFIVDVAQRQPSDVLVSDLPKQLTKQAAKLYTSIAAEANQEVKALEQFFGAAMGVSVNSSSLGNPSSMQLKTTLSNVADDSGVPLVILAWASIVMTGLNASYNYGPDQPDKYGYGLYALRPPVSTGGAIPGIIYPPLGSFLPDASATIDGYSITDILDAQTSAKVMAQRLIKAAGSLSTLVGNQSNLTALQNYLQQAEGRTLPNVDMTSAYNTAKQFAHTSVVIQPTQNGLPAVNPNSFTWADLLNVAGLLTQQEHNTVVSYYQNYKSPWLAALVYRLKYYNSKLRLARPTNSAQVADKNSIFIAGSDADLRATFDAFAFDTSIDNMTLVGPVGDQWWNPNTAQTAGGRVSYLTAPIGAGNPTGIIFTQNQAPTNISLYGQFAQGTGGTGDPTVSWDQMASFTAVSAFASNFAFPTDIIESNLLTGEKALMNDTACLDAVKQFCAASMRTFRSLPDGRFLAFYPDYFGATRQPYWSVNNIELVNFGIVLNDEQLATHVYVVGDTIDFNDQIDLLEEIGTTGVATLTQASMLQSFLEPWDPNSNNPTLTSLFDAYSFLQHYGARPYKEEQPIIRNAAFEFLYAWQRFMQKWSQLFSTTVEMTFQPEIMAGGLVAFPDHNVQMFVESVTHTFDYEAGFETSCVLSAPSIPKGTNPIDASKLPGMALAGSINSVGVSGS